MVDWRNTRCWVMSQLLQLLKVYVAQVMIVAAPSAQKTKVALRLAQESRLVESPPPATRKVYWGRNGPSLELIFSAVSY